MDVSRTVDSSTGPQIAQPPSKGIQQTIKVLSVLYVLIAHDKRTNAISDQTLLN